MINYRNIIFTNENHDIAIAMSSSRADPVLGLNILQGWLDEFKKNVKAQYLFYENHDIAIAMSSSRADPVLGLNILQGWLGVFKYLIQCYCTGWGYLNI